MSQIHLASIADQLPQRLALHHRGPGGRRQRQGAAHGRLAYPDETHDFDEALLVLDGQMNLDLQGRRVQVAAGEVYIVPAGVPHAVAEGSHGTLVIIDR